MQYAQVTQMEWGGAEISHKARFATKECLNYFKKENPSATINFISEKEYYTSDADRN